MKFRKMAASAFAFYRGTACLFYPDLERRAGAAARTWTSAPAGCGSTAICTRRTSARTWTPTAAWSSTSTTSTRRTSAPSPGTCKRFAASVALIGYAKALSDEQITELVRVYAAAYRERIHALATGAKNDEVPPFTLDTAEGPLLDALRDARSLTRFGLLDSMTEIRDFERRFAPGGGAIELDAATRYKVLAAFDGYLETLPESSPDPPGLLPGQGRGGPPGHRHRLGRACPRTTSCWRATATPWRTTW